MININDVEVFFKFICGINGHAATVYSESLMESISRECGKIFQTIGTVNSAQDLQNIGLIQQAQDLILKGYTEAASNKVDAELYLTHFTDRNIKQSGTLELWKKHVQMNQNRIVSVHFEENHETEITDILISVFAHTFGSLVYVSLKKPACRN
ncbi:hypothetical protein DPMN_184179 [Dreissena polymorpha]|uniref:Uncharacterized protein n=1 Tax=Dreissena polymorpha TaxID=45954 RepID=A0A9D4DIR6_DREPO|nr:hypothetical protein DPMN_184179 [Dreissena polymorpha]